MKRLVLLFILLIASVLFSQSTLAQLPTDTPIPFPSPNGPQFATCDLCGFCVTSQDQTTWINITPPGNWESCRQCLYPSAAPDPRIGDTLKLDAAGAPPEPKSGRHYTQLGCLTTDLGNFASTGAAGGVVQTLLNVIFAISGGVAFLYLIYGAFIVATSQGDVERLNQGKRVITGSAVGVAFVLLSVFLVNLIATGILKIPGFAGH